HASTPGSHGNIQALDINGVASSSLFVKNLEPFTGGQDERSFQTVNKSDIDKAVSPMKSTLTQGMQGALQGQLKPNEQLYMLPCAPMITSDHQPGDEATKVTVTVSETCSAVAYDNGQLQREAMRLMT